MGIEEWLNNAEKSCVIYDVLYEPRCIMKRMTKRRGCEGLCVQYNYLCKYLILAQTPVTKMINKILHNAVHLAPKLSQTELLYAANNVPTWTHV